MHGEKIDLMELRRRCAQRLEEWPLPRPFDLEEFCEAVARRRGRPIMVHPITGLGAPLGVWLATSSVDLIGYEANTSRVHQEHIVLHELSHMLCEHSPRVNNSNSSSRLFPDLRADVVQRVLQRSTTYSSAEEAEAEILASLVQERAAIQDVKPAEPDLAERLDKVLRSS